MQFKAFILFLVPLFINESDDSKWYLKFLEAMYADQGVRFNAVIDQKQYDLDSKILAYVEVVNSKNLLIEIDNETIVLKGDTIQTYNKRTSQLVIDRLIDGDIGIFSLLSGNLNNVDIIRSVLSKNTVKIIFSLPFLKYNGFVEILKTGEPKRMKLSFSDNQYVDIAIDEFTIGSLSKFNNFKPSPKETIDLYE